MPAAEFGAGTRSRLLQAHVCRHCGAPVLVIETRARSTVDVAIRLDCCETAIRIAECDERLVAHSSLGRQYAVENFCEVSALPFAAAFCASVIWTAHSSIAGIRDVGLYGNESGIRVPGASEAKLAFKDGACLPGQVDVISHEFSGKLPAALRNLTGPQKLFP